MKVKKILKVIGTILLVLIVLILIHTIRNMIIINKISSRIEFYQNADNYYVKSVSTQGATIESFNKDGRYLNKFVSESPTGTRIMIRCGDGNTETTYIEVETDSGTEKIAMKSSSGIMGFQQITNRVYTDDIKHLISMSALSSIKSTVQNGKKCYRISYINLMFQNLDFGIIIEKETGLTVRDQNGAMVNENGDEIPISIDYEYQFGTVTDEDLIEPDISEYKIQENNSN